MCTSTLDDRPTLAGAGRRALAASFLGLFLSVAARGAAAQEWAVNLAGASAQFETSAYADISCNNLGGAFVMPGPLDAGLCPCIPFAPGPAGSVVADDAQSGVVGPFLWIDPSGMLTLHFGGAAGLAARDESMPGDNCGPLDYASSAPIAIVTGNGLGTRSLSIHWWAEVSNERTYDGPFGARACAELLAALDAMVVDLPQFEYTVRYDWWCIGDADHPWECPDPANQCANWGIPAREDVEFAELDLDVAFDGDPTFPGNLLSNLRIDNDLLTPEPGVFGTPWAGGAVSKSAGQSFTASIDMAARAHSQMIGPELNNGNARFQGKLKLHLIVREFDTDEPFATYMRTIPAGGGPGTGPQYELRVGRHEITNQQYADFLNSADYDLGATELSSNMVFQSDGGVTLPDGTPMFEPQGVNGSSRIVYDSFAPVGTRYTVEVPLGSDPRSYEKHPVVNVSWYGALKFCNWLTLKQGLGAGQRCYSEGASAGEWHPATITTAAWSMRDLNAFERNALVTGYRGFRLPMDDLGTASGWIGGQQSSFNEWYRAAAWDPAAPAFARTGPGAETVSPYHWTYGFGRDFVGPSDANYVASTDPFDDDDASVGMYDGSSYNGPGSLPFGDGSSFATSANDNPWGIYDLSGNVAELLQDRPTRGARAVRGGSWQEPSSMAAASHRRAQLDDALASDVGFRIVQAIGQRTKILPMPTSPLPSVTFTVP